MHTCISKAESLNIQNDVSSRNKRLDSIEYFIKHRIVKNNVSEISKIAHH